MLTGTLANGQPVSVPIWVQAGAQLIVNGKAETGAWVFFRWLINES